MEAWVQIIGTVGFPIVACIACAMFIKYMTDKHREEIQRLTDIHREELQLLTEKHDVEASNFVQAINNNTLVMQKLIDKLGGEKDD